MRYGRAVQKPDQPPIGLVLSRTARAVSRAFDARLAASGGSLPVWLILLALRTTEIANQRELAAAVGIQGATLTHHLNGMESDGLLTRRRDPANRRVHLVELTAAGEQLFGQLRSAAIAHDKQLRTGLSDEDIGLLGELLVRMHRNVTGDREPRPAVATAGAGAEPPGAD
jgi:MarR family transcriptional regulator, transcriptional regulator for hemolysin